MPVLPKPKDSAAAPVRQMPSGYRCKLLLAWLIIVWENLWRGLWPVFLLVSAFVAVALLGVFPLLPGWLHALLLTAIVAGMLALIWGGMHQLAVPRHADARRRLERASGLQHRPLQTLDDRMADGIGDAGSSERLWQMHRVRMLDAAKNMRIGLPHPGVAARDPLALRFAVTLFLVIAAITGWRDAGERLTAAVTPNFSLVPDSETPRLELWIVPPAYTGQPPIFPNNIASAVAEPTAKPLPAVRDEAPEVMPSISVPAGSKLTARLSGRSGQTELILGETKTPFQRIDARNASIAVSVETSGRLAVEQDGDILDEWRLELIPDHEPVIAFASPPSATERGALMITYTAGDDYGVDQVTAEIRRSYESGAVIGKQVETLELTLLGRNTKTTQEISYHDLTPHRWAGMPVVIRLKVADGIGQTAMSDHARLALPEREFRHPVARAIIEQRKRLTDEPERRISIAHALAEIASRPESYQHRTVTFLALSAARSRLIHDPPQKAVEPVSNLMWETALGVEDGRLSIAERALRRAQRELAEALGRNAPDDELERLMNQLQRALNDFMRELAQQIRRGPDQQPAAPFDPHTRLLESTDLERMMKQIRNLLRAGARDAARQMLAQLQNLLENLQTGRPMQAHPQAQAGNQVLQQLQRLIQRQTELMNRSFRQSQSQGPRPRPSESRQNAMTQRELQQALKQLREALSRVGMRPGQTNGPGGAFHQADQNMGDSARALDRNTPGDSVHPQGRAIEALRRAGRGVVQQMMNQMGRRNGSGLDQPFNPMQQGRDPLGRYLPNPQNMDTRDVMIPDESAVERAQRILQELRRRAGQRQRPQLELDYIDRLLRRF